MSDYLTLGEAAKKLGVVAATAKKWLKKLKPKKVGRELQYDRKTFEAWLKKRPERPKIGRPPGSGKAAKARTAKTVVTRKKAGRKPGRPAKTAQTTKSARRGARKKKAVAASAEPKRRGRPPGKKKRGRPPKAEGPVKARVPAGANLPTDAVSATAFAQMIGKSAPSIYNWITAGMPSHTVERKTRAGRFVSPAEAAPWLYRNKKITKEQFEELTGAPAVIVGKSDGVEYANPVIGFFAATPSSVPDPVEQTLSPLAQELLRQERERGAAERAAAEAASEPGAGLESEPVEPVEPEQRLEPEPVGVLGEEVPPASDGLTFSDLVARAERAEKAAMEQEKPATPHFENLLAGQQRVEEDGPATPGLLDEEEKPVETDKQSDTLTPEDLLSIESGEQNS